MEKAFGKLVDLVYEQRRGWTVWLSAVFLGVAYVFRVSFPTDSHTIATLIGTTALGKALSTYAYLWPIAMKLLALASSLTLWLAFLLWLYGYFRFAGWEHVKVHEAEGLPDGLVDAYEVLETLFRTGDRIATGYWLLVVASVVFETPRFFLWESGYVLLLLIPCLVYPGYTAYRLGHFLYWGRG